MLEQTRGGLFGQIQSNRNVEKGHFPHGPALLEAGVLVHAG